MSTEITNENKAAVTGRRPTSEERAIGEAIIIGRLMTKCSSGSYSATNNFPSSGKLNFLYGTCVSRI